MQILVAGLVFASVTIVAAVVLFLAFSEERQVARALKAVSEWEGQQAEAAEPLLRPFRARVLAPMGQGIAGVVRSFVPDNARAKMAHRLDLAGNPFALPPEGIVSLRVIATLVFALLAGVGMMLAGVALSTWSVLAVLLAGVAGFAAPGLWLLQLQQRRQDAIRRALPDMLDMLTISVQAGLGFDMALSKLVRSTEGPLVEEFSQMLSEVQAGVSRRDALRSLAERTDVQELDNFVVAMVQADVFGVSISGILRTQAVELRKKRRQRAEELAQKAPVKMVFPIILCILPATMLVIIGPAVISIGRAFGLIS